MKKGNSQKLKIQKALSVLTILIGGLLMIYMILIEDEPGAIPLFLILIGTGWFFWNRAKIKKQTM